MQLLLRQFAVGGNVIRVTRRNKLPFYKQYVAIFFGEKFNNYVTSLAICKKFMLSYKVRILSASFIYCRLRYDFVLLFRWQEFLESLSVETKIFF